jgi:predicted AlkP superfamily phosphohydrolase/phosphomutase
MTRRSPSVVVIGLDAMDPGIARDLARAGALPTIGRLFETAAWAPTRNPPGLVVGGVWPSFATGCWPSRHGFYDFRRIEPGTYDIRPVSLTETRVPPFWSVVSAAGRRCAVIDVPLTETSPGINGLQVVEWGSHDRGTPFATTPTDFRDVLLSEFGEYPVGRCNDYSFRDDRATLLRDLLIGIEMKTRFAQSTLTREAWDLFVVVHGASHCAGHQFWHIHDSSHPNHSREERANIGDGLVEVYCALDGALGRLLQEVGDDSTVMVLLSHGMGAHYGGDHVLAEVLARLDEVDAPRARSLVLRERARRFAGRRRRTARGAVSVDGSRRFFKIPNNELYGGIRFNLIGREPRGRVHPGDEADKLASRLRADLMSLVDADDGKPVVRDVVRTDDLYERSAHDALPDLFVDWFLDRPITGVTSPKIGTVRGTFSGIRTGDHRPDGLVFARGAGIRAGRMRGSVPVPVVDLAPTIAAWLGVDLGDVDGAAVEELIGGVQR